MTNNQSMLENEIRNALSAIHFSDPQHVPFQAFSREQWAKAGQAGLMGIGLPEKYGGCGGGDLEIAITGQVIAETCRDMGFSLSWLVQILVSRLIATFGTDTQQKTLLPQLISGKQIICFAVSEPDVGPHPKYLKTKAVLSGDHYIIDGEKIWITNAPVADMFIIIAITKEQQGKKYYSAFIVPAQTPGVTVSKPFDMPFFKTSPHGGIQLKQVKVPTSNRLGEPDGIYETMVIPFSAIENAMMMGPVTGGFEAQKTILMMHLKKKKATLPNELSFELAQLETMIYTAKLIVNKAAALARVSDSARESLFLLIFFRDLGKKIQSQIEKIVDLAEIQPGNVFKDILNDLECSRGLGEKSILQKQTRLGRTLFEAFSSEPGFNK
ncbi:MAG: acyl-CoA dehydrogenase family protein [Proteobacteria bacterium]|nr:acyl-CoA dehydrogenase family protein [Pseudomonadota bacterium]